MINVSTEVKALFEAEAKAVCKALNAKHEQFNQEMNAITAFRCLKSCEKKWPGDQNKVLEVLHKAGNASANRQAIAGAGAKKEQLATAIAAELLKPSA